MPPNNKKKSKNAGAANVVKYSNVESGPVIMISASFVADIIVKLVGLLREMHLNFHVLFTEWFRLSTNEFEADERTQYRKLRKILLFEVVDHEFTIRIVYSLSSLN